MQDGDERPIEEVVEAIVEYNRRICDAWSSAHGWAPRNAAALLAKSRLDRQVSLSCCLRLWLNTASNEGGEGRLILAWANLGALVEGTMKWCLSVFEGDYSRNPVVHKGKAVPPDRLRFEDLRQFFQRNGIWAGPHPIGWDKWIGNIQQRRNAIHAYKDQDIGDFDEFWEAVRGYHHMIEELDRAPWPEGQHE